MQVLRAPDESLRVKTKQVKKITPELLKIIDQMIKLTKTFVDPEGVGLASTQVGLNGQFFVAKRVNGKKEDFVAVFNPQILSFGKKTKKFFEGCLSIPNYWAEVERPTTVKVRYMDKEGNIKEEILKGVNAWIFQHEVDHLNSKLFMDLALEQQSRVFKVVGRDRAGAEIFEEIKL